VVDLRKLLSTGDFADAQAAHTLVTVANKKSASIGEEMSKTMDESRKLLRWRAHLEQGVLRKKEKFVHQQCINACDGSRY
jgi:hypothetical protein